MDYEKKYNEALERARMILCNIPDGSASINDIETIFPELKESEDEMIKEGFRTLLQGIRRKGGLTLNKVPIDKCEAWLEKQKEQKPEEYVDDDRIRKELIEYHKQQFENNRDQEIGLFHKDAIAYLEKQKEPHYTKRNALFDKCVENCDPKVMKEVSDKVDIFIIEKED